jgi:ribosomal protein S18 acetylase RimI-like enzyme
MGMNDQAVTLRPANPEFKEGLLFAHYLDQAADGFFRLMLGRESETIIASAFADSGHTLSYENVTFAEVDKKMVGMSSAFTDKQHRLFTDEPLLRAAKRSALRLKLMGIIFAPIWRILENIPEGDFYVQGIAVEPELRGAGIGSLLMKDLEDRAKTNGSSRLSLDVSAKNNDALRFYKRLGMVEASAWPNSRFFPNVFIRMSKYL